MSEGIFSKNPISSCEIKEKYSLFISRIEEAATKSIPINKQFTIGKRPPPPWWDHECDAAVQHLKDYILNSSTENFVEVKKTDSLNQKIPEIEN